MIFRGVPVKKITLYLREGFRKKNPYFLWSFAKPGGGGSARVVKNLADFPAVFLHISYFDICHEIQQAVVTPYRAYQNV